MPLTKSAARTKVRLRIRDTVATYEYSDANLDTYLAPALREIAVAVREVDSDYYLKAKSYAAYTDAVDPGPGNGEQAWEFYALPPDFAEFRWCERMSGGVVQYRFRESSARDQEGNRNVAGVWFNNQVAIANSALGTSTSYNLGQNVGLESLSVHGSRFRVIPPPTAAGAIWRFWYSAQPADPTGESEPLDIPPAFEEALIRFWGRAPLLDDGSPIGASLSAQAEAELVKAKAAHRNRVRRNLIVGKVW